MKTSSAYGDAWRCRLRCPPMSPSLPADQAQLLLDEMEQLRRTRRELTVELDALAGHVERLRNRLAQP